MAIVFDLQKNQRNIDARGLSFEMAERFAWQTASIEVDRRRDYGEVRFMALGVIDGRLHVLILFTMRRADIRIISLRRANKREQAAHAKKTRSLSSRR